MGPTILTLWYHHISTSQLCHNTTLVMPQFHYSVTLWYPHISPSWLRHGTQECYSGIGQSRIYTMPYSSSLRGHSPT